MADKAISELVAAEQITATDMFVLEQNGTAKKLTGQVLLNWLTKAADGHGGIQSIIKFATKGLADTYRITLADTTTFDFVVTNGKGINSITKTATAGLVDTYTISYNDGTSDTITVTNGAKGDPGDTAHLWIKYASQEPTEQSHSIGDVPDNWIGVYAGYAAAAPTNWKQYQWFKYKGEQGDKGDPAVLSSSAVSYQAGTSGTVPPSGSWGTSIPAVTPGQYLWTRIVHTFNTGSPVTAYTVSRFGIDGTGAVSTVNGIAPDEEGNVSVDAKGIGARPNLGGTAIFFGDSLTAGYNNNDRSFADFISDMGIFDTVIKHATSGSGFSTYGGVMPSPSLEEFISTYEDEIRDADYIFVEYGSNDGFHIDAGVITLDQAKEKAVSTMQSIRQLNPTAHIVYLASVMDPYALAIGVLQEETRSAMRYAKILTDTVSKTMYVPVVALSDRTVAGDGFMSDDGLHPNDAGHERIANAVISKMFQTEPESYEWTVDYSESMYLNFDAYYWYIISGGRLVVRMSQDGATLIGTAQIVHEYAIMITFDGKSDLTIRATLTLMKSPAGQTLVFESFANQEYVDNKKKRATVTLLASGWSGEAPYIKQSVACEGVTTDNDVLVSPAVNLAHDNITVYSDCRVRCQDQWNGLLDFYCDEAPGIDLTANVLILD